ncbi:MAG: hypothetical protein CL693_21425 [Cellvibrionaceae bacterium]|nr:hypothetical protein [Cellvibrionaceae bacterium]
MLSLAFKSMPRVGRGLALLTRWRRYLTVKYPVNCFRFVALLSLAVPAAVAMDDMMEQLTLQHGLSQSTVFAIEQDAVGFMWFGTRNGLNRFDGYQFRHYMADQGLPSSFVWSVEREGDSLWLGTQGGGLVERLKNGEFVSYASTPAERLESSSDTEVRPQASNDSSSSPKVIVDVKRSHDGGLWLAT